ncbi:PPE domain-containing protein [Nocardia cyriacigeorgica]|uniref:PPE domain-containing protein n=1 Tax=Nocardia cyriacigeorgica TaxID=135487 RepID=A0A6P1D3N7_9NOCA|nr:PPE domain-containing protein [Nocardia cyriacigeorgica]NEW40679.1 PPE domain-containing protein [Nocardia cyriacigeorgica]NEW44074.1 PPE domain-containing protein [Nocardia cyriacigeorgica]NEW51093.1 PPE domain-containing protein [Nocardia cyriacigeorgica]NEW54324.1 PPE domain-containing protein [Nocardia cyriacigeorgica]
MELNVDLGALVAAASALSTAAGETARGLPPGWVTPAGADPISAGVVPQLNNQAATLVNGTIDVLNAVAREAHKIGTSAANYSLADDEGARAINGSGADLVADPVGEPQVLPHRVPPVPTTLPAGGVDSLEFAERLRQGPGPGPAHEFANALRGFTREVFPIANQVVSDASTAMKQWTPVGEKAAKNLTRYQGWLDRLATGMTMLADSVDSYGDAFRRAKAKHPPPEEIKAARKDLIAAMRSKNEAWKLSALERFENQNLQSATAIGGYEAEMSTQVPGETAGGEAVQGQGGQTGGQGPGGEGSGSEMDPSMMANMMSALTNAMSSMGNLPLDQSAGEYLDDYALGDELYDDYGGFASPGGFGGGFGGGGGAGAMGGGFADSAMVAPPAPLTAAAAPASTTQGLPRAPVIEALPASASASGAAAGRGAGMPMMPMMPMAPGAGAGGGAGGDDRNRVVAWHPDRLMYVDDTPHTEMVIGERPTVAPSVTPPTPNSGAGNQHSSQSGGSA